MSVTTQTQREASRPKNLITYVVLIAGAVLVLAPFIWMLRSVALPDHLLYSQNGAPLIPTSYTLDHLRQLWDGGFYWNIANSFIITGASVVSNVLFCGLAGYALARRKFLGSTAIFAMVVIMLAMPVQSRIVPLYVLVGKLGLIDTRLGVALPVLITSTGIFLMRQYVLSIPRAIDEAAYLDGCSAWRLYWTIIFPICRPVLATIAIFSAVTAWNDFLWPLVTTTSQDKQTLPLAIASLSALKSQLNWGTTLTASFLALVPVLVLYLALQRQFISGITGGAVK